MNSLFFGSVNGFSPTCDGFHYDSYVLLLSTTELPWFCYVIRPPKTLPLVSSVPLDGVSYYNRTRRDPSLGVPCPQVKSKVKVIFTLSRTTTLSVSLSNLRVDKKRKGRFYVRV